MDKKSFFRGFGSGVIFASLILGISFMVRISDPYVTSRAKELGMVYDSDSKLLADKNAENGEETPVPEETEIPDEDKETEAPVDTAGPEISSVPTSDVKTSETPTKSPADEANDIKKELEREKDEIEKEVKKKEEEQEKNKQEQKKKLTVDVGDWSSDVSKKLESLGIVKSAKDFDKYLNDNGYSSSINAGTYDVSVKDTYEELARKITKR